MAKASNRGFVLRRRAELANFLSKQPGYQLLGGGNIYYRDYLVATIFKKDQFYDFLKTLTIDWREVISKQPPLYNGFYLLTASTLFIIERKFQPEEEFTAEELQSCDFKKKQYQKLMAQTDIEVEYVYLLSDWFRKPEYKDVLDYIISVRCQYYFEYIPLQKLGLPVPG